MNQFKLIRTALIEIGKPFTVREIEDICYDIFPDFAGRSRVTMCIYWLRKKYGKDAVKVVRRYQQNTQEQLYEIDKDVMVKIKDEL